MDEEVCHVVTDIFVNWKLSLHSRGRVDWAGVPCNISCFATILNPSSNSTHWALEFSKPHVVVRPDVSGIRKRCLGDK